MTQMKIKDILALKYGKDQKKALEIKGNNPILGTGGIIGRTGDYLYDKPSVLIGRKGSVENTYYIDTPFWTIDTLFYTEINTKLAMPKWFYYKTKKIRFERLTEGTGVPSLTAYAINNVIIEVPSLDYQKMVVNKISPFDEKIKQNNELIALLEGFTKLTFHKWFVDYNLTSEDGQLASKNKQVLPKEWKRKKLGDLTTITTGKKDANHATEDGLYPFYTCSSEQLKSPSYSFDTKAMILAGNGEFWFNRFEGKFEAYQRNYIIESNSNKMFDYLYLNIDKYLNKITSRSSGSIIKYLTKGMITELEVILPDEETLQKFNEIVNPCFQKIDLLQKENIHLEQMRDLLIQKFI